MSPFRLRLVVLLSLALFHRAFGGWFFGSSGESCDDVCSINGGGNCISTDLAKIDAPECINPLRTAFNAGGFTVAGAYGSLTAPQLVLGQFYYFDSTQTLVTVTCSDSHSSVRRLCSCDGIGTAVTFPTSCGTFAGSTGDPHLSFANGGTADFRGIHGTIFAFLSAVGFQVNVMTTARTFSRWGGQVVHGSFITRAFLKIRSAKTGAVFCVALFAEQYDRFRTYEDCDAPAAAEHGYYNHTRLEKPGLEVMQASSGKTYVHASGFEFTVRRRRLARPLLGNVTQLPPGCVPNRRPIACFFFDMSFKVLDDDADKVAKFGKSTLGTIAPHGIIGQSFDGSKLAVSGKHDDYGNGPEFTTSAQAEGAIEGTYKDYILPMPFSTVFKYGRFDASTLVAPRDVSKLTGAKQAAVSGAMAGSVELHVDAETLP